MTWYVYALIDPRDGAPFYIGITINPKRRAPQHRTDPASAGYHRVREIHALGLKCLLRPLATFASRHEARKAEDRLISTIAIGKLTNGTGP